MELLLFAENQEALFNPNCKNISFLHVVRARCWNSYEGRSDLLGQRVFPIVAGYRAHSVISGAWVACIETTEGQTDLTCMGQFLATNRTDLCPGDRFTGPVPYFSNTQLSWDKFVELGSNLH